MSISPMFIAVWDYHVSRQFSACLLKPGLKPVSGLFGRSLLPLLLVEFGAIRQSLISRRAAALVHEIATPRRRAACDPSVLVAGVTPMMSSMATRVSTPMSSGVPSSACKYRRSTEDKDYADD